MRDTIFAVSSGAPPSAIAVLRISGPRALAAGKSLAGILPSARRASLRAIRARDGSLIDRAVMLVLPGPASATGEDIVELHLHGGRAIIRAVEAELLETEGLRAAEPGEFTRRALEAGRIDLTEAEGLADLLAAETEGQRRAAMRAAEGFLRRHIERWTTQTVTLAAAMEAVIDHNDEDDIGTGDAIMARVAGSVASLVVDIETLLAQPPVERLRDGIRVVLAGPPNSGKSTLFNAMVGRDAAIVSPIAGTTRDRIEAPVVRGGSAWLFIDTAGLAIETDDAIEAIGIARAKDSLSTADLVLWLGDDEPPPDIDAILIYARADIRDRGLPPPRRIVVSGKTGAGIDDVWVAMREHAQRLLPADDVITLNARQRGLCHTAAVALRAIDNTVDPLIIAEELRIALEAFDKLTGRADTEAVLDSLFQSFCIGK